MKPVNQMCGCKTRPQFCTGAADSTSRNERGLLAVAYKPLLGRDSTTEIRKGG